MYKTRKLCFTACRTCFRNQPYNLTVSSKLQLAKSRKTHFLTILWNGLAFVEIGLHYSRDSCTYKGYCFIDYTSRKVYVFNLLKYIKIATIFESIFHNLLYFPSRSTGVTYQEIRILRKNNINFLKLKQKSWGTSLFDFYSLK